MSYFCNTQIISNMEQGTKKLENDIEKVEHIAGLSKEGRAIWLQDLRKQLKKGDYLVLAKRVSPHVPTGDKKLYNQIRNIFHNYAFPGEFAKKVVLECITLIRERKEEIEGKAAKLKEEKEASLKFISNLT